MDPSLQQPPSVAMPSRPDALTVCVDRTCRLFVLNLAWSTTEDELQAHLESAFESAGVVRAVTILRRNHDGRSRGVAKVVMCTPSDVTAAIESLNGEELAGRTLTLSHDKLDPR